MAEIRVDIDVDCGHRWCATSICCPPLLDRRNGFRGFVIVRMSDFKTNEYANLLGGTEFEPREENPMLGFRGASRSTRRNIGRGSS
jgi:PEP-utilising enzyme, PEP-binding domain